MLRSAAAVLDDWLVHIGAMNKFTAGVVTLDQLNAFWDRTRIGAADRLREFDTAVRRLRALPADCPQPSQIKGRDAGLRMCAEAARARRGEVRAAGTAAKVWAKQMREMQQLRSGARSDADAKAGWIDSWPATVLEVQDLSRVVREAPDGAGKSSVACPRP